MTIAGVKNILNINVNKLDVYDRDSLKTNYYKKILKSKTKTILEKLIVSKIMAKTHLKVRRSQKVTLIVNLFITQKNQQKVKKLKTS